MSEPTAGVFQQFQDAFLSQHPHPNQHQYYLHQRSPPATTYYSTPNNNFIDYQQNSMYGAQGPQFYQGHPNWQPDSYPQHPHPQRVTSAQGPHQYYNQRPPQQPYSGNPRGGRGRGRGVRGQGRQKYQEFNQKFQNNHTNPELPVETLRPQPENHRIKQEVTYNEVIAITPDSDAVQDISRGRGRGKYGGRGGNAHRNNHGRHFDNRPFSHNQSDFHAMDGRGHARGGRGGGGRGGMNRNDIPQNKKAHSDSSQQGSNLNNKRVGQSNEHEKSPDSFEVSTEINRKNGKVKFRDLRAGNRKDNSSSKGQPKGKSKIYKKINLNEGDIETQRGALIEQLTSAEYECMVCCDSVRQNDAVWSCTNCFHVFHLRCVKRWARSPAASADGDKSGGWRCPACQNISQQFPHHYTCFCAKLRDPEWNRFDTPHSCGEVCKKQRTVDCIHPCTILCHPGPCPPCYASVTKACDCGKTKQTVKCGQPAPKCVEVCQKLLNCGKHECSAVCHPGACQPCDINVNQVCYCGKEKREVICGTSESFSLLFSCEATCRRGLDCGNHICEMPCHPGACAPCPLRPEAVTHCACGKKTLKELGDIGRRTSCLDPVPTCENICDKVLKCGPKDKPHRCKLVCHPGECDPCEDQTTSVVCRCAILEKEFPCREAGEFTSTSPFLCDKRCNKKRQCGRHRCPIVCCVEEEHPCNQICGGKLSCGLHRCEEPCHRGNCPTCWHVSFDELHCQCGAEVIYPPIPCGTKPPPCNKMCRREHSCDHPVRHPCHSEVQCPPCTELTERWCMGRHELRRNIACHLVDISCGLPCGRKLHCNLHSCQQICHKGECETDEVACQQPCNKVRAECGHPCGAPCHGESQCPRTPCQAQITIKCKCGNRSERALCQLGGNTDTQEYQKMATMMMAMKMADVQSGQSIDITSLTSGEGTKKKARQLECTKECAILERNKRLALALEIKNPDIQGKLGNPTYSLFLRDFAKQNISFMTGIEKELSNLVMSAQKSKQPKRSHAFPPMNSAQRRVIHELAEAYGCQTQSYDVEPKKNVVATAYKDRCWQPTLSLVNVVMREIYPKGPAPIPHSATEMEPNSARGSTEIKSKSTKIKMTAWGKGSSATSTKPKSESPEPEMPAPVLSWASQVRRSTPPITDSNRSKSPEIDYFDMAS